MKGAWLCMDNEKQKKQAEQIKKIQNLKQNYKHNKLDIIADELYEKYTNEHNKKSKETLDKDER